MIRAPRICNRPRPDAPLCRDFLSTHRRLEFAVTLSKQTIASTSNRHSLGARVFRNSTLARESSHTGARSSRTIEYQPCRVLASRLSSPESAPRRRRAAGFIARNRRGAGFVMLIPTYSTKSAVRIFPARNACSLGEPSPHEFPFSDFYFPPSGAKP